MKNHYVTMLLIACIAFTMCSQGFPFAAKEQLRSNNNKKLEAIFIIPGISGDLAKRKLIPAFNTMLKEGRRLFVIGTGRGQQTTDAIINTAIPFLGSHNAADLKRLKDSFLYHQLNPEKPEDYKVLKELLEKEIEEKYKGSDAPRIVYLSTPSDTFCTYTKGFVESCIVQSKNPVHRIVYEKPFGTDEASARAINSCISRLLREHQIYRIDHYLAKTLIQAFPTLRDENVLLNSAWSNKGIESVHIFLNETIDIEGRGSFYDSYGLLKDVFQNHALQLLALVALKNTRGKTPDQISDLKAKVFSHLHIEDGILGQYEGYREEKGVDLHSRTETYASIALRCDLPQWKGVPFFITAGKALDKRRGEIVISFKNRQGSNSLVIRLSPQEEVVLTLLGYNEASLKSEIPLKSDVYPFGQQDAYQTLLNQILKGDRSSTVSMKEILEQWRIINAIHKQTFPLCSYKKGSAGPDEIKKLICFL